MWYSMAFQDAEVIRSDLVLGEIASSEFDLVLETSYVEIIVIKILESGMLSL